MGRIFSALGRFWALPFSKLGREGAVYDGPVAGFGELTLTKASGAAAKEPTRLRRAWAATSDWTKEQAVGFGFLTTLFVGVCGLSSALLIEERDTAVAKVAIGAAGMVGGYLALLLVLTLVFWVSVGAKAKAA
jgi:hypothetical protein